jgi:hypothetical protein
VEVGRARLLLSPDSPHLTVSVNFTAYIQWHILSVFELEYPFILLSLAIRGHAVAQLVEALRYKPADRGFDSRWCH